MQSLHFIVAGFLYFSGSPQVENGAKLISSIFDNLELSFCWSVMKKKLARMYFIRELKKLIANKSFHWHPIRELSSQVPSSVQTIIPPNL